MKLRNINIGIRLMISFFLISSIAAAVIGYISFSSGKESLKEESFNRLTAVREMKATQIEEYFHAIRDQITTFSHNPTVVNGMIMFDSAFHKLPNDLNVTNDGIDDIETRIISYYKNEFMPRLNQNLSTPINLESILPAHQLSMVAQDQFIAKNDNNIGSKHLLNASNDSSQYNNIHTNIHPYIREYLDKFGYYDIFLINNDGEIVYSVFKEVDFATSLRDGPFKNSNLANVFNTIQNSSDLELVKLVDYHPYHPSYDSHAAFIATSIIRNGKRIGVLAFQLPIDRINKIMTNSEKWREVGLGESGETYIVGNDHTLRNQSRFLIEDSENYFKLIEDLNTPKETIEKIRSFNSSIGLQEVQTIGTEAALAGKKDTKIFPDYRGVNVLSAYKPLDIADMQWVIMSEIDEAEAFHHIYDLRTILLMVFGLLIILIVIISIIIAKRITRPLKHLTGGAKQLAKGNMDAIIKVGGKDEVGVLALSFKKMQISIKNLIHELKDINQNLEKKVEERTYELQVQKEMIEEKNREIVDSITYAQRLQNAILPKPEKIKALLPDSFILFQPKDIVSGDFYWMNEHSDGLHIAAVDCTGHGVPGAMVSVVGSNGLSRCVKEFGLSKPSEILDKLVEVVIDTFESHGGDDVKDGMDMALCSINLKNKTIEYAGAHNPLWIIRKGSHEVEEIKGNKQPIGMYEFMKPFTNHSIQLESGDTIYTFTDGYADQFGGPRGKKLKYKTMKTLLLSLQHESMHKQMSILEERFIDWQGDLEQVDDVCIIGVRL